MSRWLQSLVIENFRSIRREVTIPLDAPIVLLYGANAAGKTSVFSAIELALTGTVGSLERSAPGYQDHLVHHGASSGRIELTARSELPQGTDGAVSEAERQGAGR